MRRLVDAFKALTSQRTPKVDIVFKDGIGYDSEKLLQSVQGLVRIANLECACRAQRRRCFGFWLSRKRDQNNQTTNGLPRVRTHADRIQLSGAVRRPAQAATGTPARVDERKAFL